MYPHVVSGSPVFHVGNFVCDGSDTVGVDKKVGIISELSHCILVMSGVEIGSLHYIRRRTNAGALEDTCFNSGYKGCSIREMSGVSWVLEVIHKPIVAYSRHAPAYPGAVACGTACGDSRGQRSS